MNALFIKMLNMCIDASYLIIAVIILRALLSRAPKLTRLVMWALVGIRLCLPVSVESIFSLLPSREVIPQDIGYASAPAIDLGYDALNSAVNPILSHSLAPAPDAGVNPMTVLLGVLSAVWVTGVVFMLAYAAASYIRLRLRVRASMRAEKNTYMCDGIDTPFILGVIKPKIYLPSGITDEQRDHVLAHERAHLSRLDHIIKPAAFLLLCVYWFSPFVWIAYTLFCRDIELCCDERVVKNMHAEEKKAYSESLLSLSTHKSVTLACPLAFGEVGVKNRIKSVLNYKKPAFLISAAAILACIVAAVCFLTYPVMSEKGKDSVGTDGTGPSYGGEYANSGVDNDGNSYFDAVIKRISGKTLIVTPFEGALGLTAYEEVHVSLSKIDESVISSLGTGEEVRIVYDGLIAESYPPQIFGVYEIIKLSEIDVESNGGFYGERYTATLTSAAYVPITVHTNALNADAFTDNYGTHLPVYKISSKAELEAFLKNYTETLGLTHTQDELTSFVRQSEEYGDEFFEDSVLFVVYIGATKSSDRYSLSGVYNDLHNILRFYIKRDNTSDNGDAAMAGYLMCIKYFRGESEDIACYDAVLSK